MQYFTENQNEKNKIVFLFQTFTDGTLAGIYVYNHSRKVYNKMVFKKAFNMQWEPEKYGIRSNIKANLNCFWSNSFTINLSDHLLREMGLFTLI